MELYVGNLCYTMTERDIRTLFSQHGDVDNVHLITDHYTRQSKCFGYVEMKHSLEAERAIAELHGETINDRPLDVRKARSAYDRQGSPW